MRVLMLSQFYPPVIGGEEQLVRNLGQELAARGHTVAVATLGQNGGPGLGMDGSVRVYRLGSLAQRAGWLYREPGRRHAPPLPDPETVLELRKALQRERPEIVHGHNWMLHSYLPLAPGARAALVVSLHDYSLACAQKRLRRQDETCSGPGALKCLRCAARYYGPLKGPPTVLSNWGMGVVERRLVDLFLPVSLATAQGNGLERDGLPFEVIPNFIPDEIKACEDVPGGLSERLPPGDFLLYIGDLSADKGAPVLLEAYATLRDAPPLVMIGRCDYPASLGGALPAKVHLLGSWPHAGVMAAWRRCLFGIVPSVWPEPFGLVAIEAMISGKAVIASRAGGLSDIVVDGETGLLVPPGDAGALGAAITRLLADSGTRERMGAAGKNRVKQFQASTVIPRVEAAYRRALAKKGDRRGAGQNSRSGNED